MKALLFFLSLLPHAVLALETDNYLAWKVDLEDSGEEINAYFNSTIESILSAEKNVDLNCQELTREIGDVFRSRLVHDNPVENHLMEILPEAKIFPTTLYFVEESIYRDPYRLYIPYFGLAPNIQVNGFYFGTDKLSHFASTGRIYYETYLKNKSLDEALRWGVRDEKSVHGYWASGIFSYADLEANYQGFLFYRRLCEGPASYLVKKNDRWTMKHSFRIQDYVSGLWDETYLENYLLPGNWEKVKPILSSEYCPLRSSSRVQNRLSHYKKHHPPHSSLPLHKGMSLPKSQSFRELCLKNEGSSL